MWSEPTRELRQRLGLGRWLTGAQRRVRVQGRASGVIPFPLSEDPKDWHRGQSQLQGGTAP